MHWAIRRLRIIRKEKKILAADTTKLGLLINRSQKVQTSDCSMCPLRECCRLRLPVLLTGLIAAEDSLTHYHCLHVDWLLQPSAQMKVLLHFSLPFRSTPAIFCLPISSFYLCGATLRTQPSRTEPKDPL